MKITGTILIILFTLTLSCAAIHKTEASGIELWMRTFEYVNNVHIPYPSSVLTQESIIDSSRSLNREIQTEIRFLQKEHKLLPEPVRHIEDGIDRTKDESVERALIAVWETELQSFRKEIPFIAKDVVQVFRGLAVDNRVINGVDCTGLNFEFSDSDMDAPVETTFATVGTLWVDPVTSIPLLVEMELRSPSQNNRDSDFLAMTRKVEYHGTDSFLQKIAEYQTVQIAMDSSFIQGVWQLSSRKNYTHRCEKQ